MPKNPNMLSNREALDAGISRAAWKMNLGLEHLSKVKYDLSKITFVDVRDIATIAAMFIDITPVVNESEEVKREFYLAKFKEIEEEYLLSDDPDAKKRFISRTYESIATHTEIDWDNPAEIDYIACSLRGQQALGTMVERSPGEVLSAYPTKSDVQKLDAINIKNLVNLGKFNNALAEKYPEIGAKIRSDVNYDSYGYRLDMDIATSILQATEKGRSTVTFNPTSSEAMKKYLIGDQFELVMEKPNPYDPEDVMRDTFDENDAAKAFMGGIYEVSGKTTNEYSLVSRAISGNRKSDLLFINGRPMSEIIEEKEREFENESEARSKAVIAAGNILRSALTDGKSVVSLMRANVIEGGKVAFTHQEIKVDLDKLNKVEHKEHYGRFRRFLNWIGFKIPNKYVSNAQRDEEQENIKLSAKYQESMRNAEKKFIDAYNKNSEKTRAEEEKRKQEYPNEPEKKDMMFNTYPEISNVVDENELNRSINNDPEKERITSLLKDIQEDKEYDMEALFEEDLDKSVDFELNAK